MKAIKRILLCIMVFAICLVGTVAFRARFFAVEASADAPLPTEVYPDFGIVIDLIPDSDLVIVQTQDGNRWAFEEIDDWMIGDYCCLVFNDNGTRVNRTDDKIVAVRYITPDSLEDNNV